MDGSITNVTSLSNLVETTDINAIQVGYSGSLTSEVNAFEASLEKAAGSSASDDTTMNEVARMVFEPLDYINKEAEALAAYAQSALESGQTMSPGEIVNLTVKSQEFMFHSQLTANVANRTAYGVQQLFRQQS